MKLIFAGTPHFAAEALTVLLQEHEIVAVLTQPDRPSGRGMKLTASPVKMLALQHDVQVLQPTTLKSEQAQQEIAALDAEVMVVAAYGLILPLAVLEMPRYGCLNIHASLLPRWRGAAPIQRAIQAGDAETGITIMQMDEGLDTGDMLLCESCPIQTIDTAASLHDKLAVLGANSILKALSLLQQEQLVPVKQDNGAACYAAKLFKSEAILDWSQSALTLHRSIRALNPFPVCKVNLNGVVIKVWQASMNIEMSGTPGEVLALDKSGIVVACAEGALCLEILQRPGGKAQPAYQFLQGIPIIVCDYFL